VVVSNTNPGVFIGTQTGCCCILAADGSVFSQEFSVDVNGAPDCCANSPTPTPALVPDDSDESNNGDSSADDSTGSSSNDSEATPELSP
jgi:hypothetical protein